MRTNFFNVSSQSLNKDILKNSIFCVLKEPVNSEDPETPILKPYPGNDILQIEIVDYIATLLSVFDIQDDSITFKKYGLNTPTLELSNLGILQISIENLSNPEYQPFSILSAIGNTPFLQGFEYLYDPKFNPKSNAVFNKEKLKELDYFEIVYKRNRYSATNIVDDFKGIVSIKSDCKVSNSAISFSILVKGEDDSIITGDSNINYEILSITPAEVVEGYAILTPMVVTKRSSIE